MNKLLVAVLALGVSFAANANSVQLKFAGANTAINTKINVNGNNLYTAMGTYNLVEQGGTPSNIVGFCVDPFQYASTSYHAYNKSSLDASDFANNGATRFANVQKLFDNAYGTLTNAVQTAGFHLALWEIFNDNQDTATGAVKKTYYTNSGMVSYANTLLASLAGWSIKNDWNLTFYQNNWKQDFITATPNPPSEVPLPAALPLFLSAICGFGVMSRRSKLG